MDTNFRDIPTALLSIHKSIKREKLANTSRKLSGQREKVDTVFQRQTALNSVLKPIAGVKKEHRPSGQLTNGSGTITILQLADIHIDQFYSEVGL